jgi:hypothetical protein
MQRLQGSILQPSGETLPRVELVLVTWSPGDEDGVQLLRTASDPKGRYEIHYDPASCRERLTLWALDTAGLAIAAVAISEGVGEDLDITVAASATEEAPTERLVVNGHVTWSYDAPVVGIVVRAFTKGMREETPLGPYAPRFTQETRTDSHGFYEIPYTSQQLAASGNTSANLVVSVLDSADATVESSPTWFDAPASATVDLTLAGAVAGQPTEYERLVSLVSPLLTPAAANISSLEGSDLDFIVGETGASRAQVGCLLSAASLHREITEVPVAAFYAITREGLPGNWAGLVQAGAANIDKALLTAAHAGIAPADLGASDTPLAMRISQLAIEQVLDPSATDTPTPLSGLLGASGLSPAQQRGLLSLATSSNGTPQEFWPSLAKQPGFKQASVERLQLTFQLGLLTGNHLPLIQAILGKGSVTSTADLIGLDDTQWSELLTSTVDGQRVGVPAGGPGSTPAEQEANYIAGLKATLQAALPNETIAHQIATNAIPIREPDSREAIAQFFTNAPDFDIRTTRISTYVAEHAAEVFKGVSPETQTAAVSELQRVQRAFQISVSSETMIALLNAELDAAHLIADIPPQSFLDRFASALGGTEPAEAIYRRAAFINSRTVSQIAQLNEVVNGAWPNGLAGGKFGGGSSAAKEQILKQYPDYAELFGALDSCECEECTSVLSPAAYLVDVLQFLRNSTPNGAGNTPLDVLIGNGPSLPGRRPDLAYLKLTCENTNTELPYIDLVNEILENYILFNGPTLQAAHDTGDVTTPELDASPQYTIEGATSHSKESPYYKLARAVYPFTLPYNLPIAVARTYLQSLESSRREILEAFQTNPTAATAAVDAEYLELDPRLYEVLTASTLAGQAATPPLLAQLYGYDPSDVSWQTSLASVPAFLQRTGIEANDLVELLQTRFVNPDYPTGPDQTFFTRLPIGYPTLMTLVQDQFATTDATILDALGEAISLSEIETWWKRNESIGQIVVIASPEGNCELERATLAQLAGQSAPSEADLGRMQSFIRLWRVLGWSMSDLDRAITTFNETSVSAALIHKLALVERLQAALNPSCLQVLFALWGPLETKGTDSLYRQLFLSAASPPQDPQFAMSANGAVLQEANVAISEHIPALLAALGVGAGDLALICEAAGLNDRLGGSSAGTPLPPEAQLSLLNVSAMYRYAALAQALELSVSDLIALRTLAGPGLDPFASPDAAGEFVTLAQHVQQSGFTVAQLAYLYENASVPPTGLAPQLTTLLVFAQTLRDGLTQIAAQCAIAPDPKGSLTASTVTQLLSKTVAAQTVALVNGSVTYSAPLPTGEVPASLQRSAAANEPITIDPTKTPPEVGAKLGYNAANETLTYTGAMTSHEQTELLAIATSSSAFKTAVESLYAQPATFLEETLAPLLADPNAATTLFYTTASVDANLNPVLVNEHGQAVTDPTQATQTAAAWKFSYLLGKLLPDLQSTLSHALAKQTVADAFSLDPLVTSTLLEQVLDAPATTNTAAIEVLLALATPGITAAYFTSPDLSGSPTVTTLSAVALGGPPGSPTLPSATQSASFTGWIEVPNSATYTFAVTTNGSPQLFVGASSTPVTLEHDSGTQLFTQKLPLVAGGFTYVRLEVTALPAAGEVSLSWQSQSTPNAPIPGSVLLPDACFQEFQLLYVRIQKAAMLCNLYALRAPELEYLATAGAHGLFAGFDLNALPLSAGTTPSQATALFAGWQRLYDYTALRNTLPAGSVSLVDVFSAPSYAAATELLPKATGWDETLVSELLASFFPAPSTDNPIVDEQWPSRLARCVALASQIGAPPAAMFAWAAYSWPSPEAAFEQLHESADQIKRYTASHYDPATWLNIAEQLSDTLRSSRRDALVSYLLGQLGLSDPDTLFELLLIDPEMGSCMATSRVRQALNSVQLFVQRCLLNLEQGETNPGLLLRPATTSPDAWRAAITLEPSQIDAQTWREFKSSYSLWAPAREVFLWPENWLLPPLREDQTPLYEAFASSLQQGTITEESVTSSFLEYLHGLAEIDRLDIRCVYWQAPEGEAAGVLHVFARTWHDPRSYFYRRRVGKRWTPWQPLGLDIEGDHLVAVIWEGRLRLIWPVFTTETFTPEPGASPLTTTSNGTQTPQPGSAPQNYWQITLAWSELYQGAWQPKQVSEDFLDSFYSAADLHFFVEDELLTGPLQPSQQGHVFKARLDGADLVVDVYATFASSVQYSPGTEAYVLDESVEGMETVARIFEAAAKETEGLIATDNEESKTLLERLVESGLSESRQDQLLIELFEKSVDVQDLTVIAVGQHQLAGDYQALASTDRSTAAKIIQEGIDEGPGPLLLGEFRFSACGDTVSTGYTALGTPPTKDAAPHQSSDTVPSARVLEPLLTEPYLNGSRQLPGLADNGGELTLLTGAFGETPWQFTEKYAPACKPITYLERTPTRYELRYSQQHWQFAVQAPFFYQDAEHTLFAEPVVSGGILEQLADPKNVDVAHQLTRLVALQASSPSTTSTAGIPAQSPAGLDLPQRADTQLIETQNETASAQPTSSLASAASKLVSGYLQVSDQNWKIPPNLLPPPPPPPGSLSFQTHRQPYVCDLIDELVRAQGESQKGGIDGLLNLANQTLPDKLKFAANYKPDAYVTHPYPEEIVEFGATGAYSDYNWELFFHAPLLVALTLSQNGQYAQADAWFRHIFDPTSSETGVQSPERYWQLQEFRTPAPETLLALMQALDEGDAAAELQYEEWSKHPFEPFRIARLRISAFQKYVFMAYLDNRLAWADYLYGQVDSIESINQATQLYVFMAKLLGEQREQIPTPHAPPEYTYNELLSYKLDAFSNICETLENEFPFAGPVSSDPQSQTSGLLGLSKTLLFCIPQNTKLLGYWSTVEQRLYNIRHCLNIQGVPQQLALFPRPASPLALIEAAAEGVDPGSVLADISAPLPNYRFSYLITKASELAASCQGFGQRFLEVLEKNDAEGLALLRANQETAVLELMTKVKQQQIAEAQANVTALSASRAVAVTRYSYYQSLLGASAPANPAVGADIPLAAIPSQPSQLTGGVQLIAEEQSELTLSASAAVLHQNAGKLQVLASEQASELNVSISVDTSPFGVGGSVGTSYGGSNLSASTEAEVHGLEANASSITYQAWAAGKMGGYLRRQQEWALQSNLAAGEIMQIDKQTAAAKTHVQIAEDELHTHELETTNAQHVQSYLTSKYTNQQLYTWMIGQVSSLYSQLYQLAYSTAKLAEVAYQRELGIPESSYITFGYWDSLRKGLLAGDRLELAVKQLERAYIDQNEREFEITRHVSLLLHDPAALIALKTTGECVVELPEELFDMDYPGQYLRRLRDVSLTIPCVAGPYTSINCTLTLVSSKVRVDPSTSAAASGYKEKPTNEDQRFLYSFGSTAAIATSHGQDDSGVFSVNFRDERYLPFETAGAVSRWLITMLPECNAFDFDTITDVVLKLSYTSRYGGDLLRSQALAAAKLPPGAQQTPPSLPTAPQQSGRERLFSLKHEFPTEWYGLLHPASTSAAYGQMPIALSSERFPFQYRGRALKITGAQVFALLRIGASLSTLPVYLTEAGAPAPAGSPPPVAPTPQASALVTLEKNTLYGPSTLSGGVTPTSPLAVPQLLWLSVPADQLEAMLAAVEDFFILLQYSVG